MRTIFTQGKLVLPLRRRLDGDDPAILLLLYHAEHCLAVLLVSAFCGHSFHQFVLVISLSFGFEIHLSGKFLIPLKARNRTVVGEVRAK